MRGANDLLRDQIGISGNAELEATSAAPNYSALDTYLIADVFVERPEPTAASRVQQLSIDYDGAVHNPIMARSEISGWTIDGNFSERLIGADTVRSIAYDNNLQNDAVIGRVRLMYYHPNTFRITQEVFIEILRNGAHNLDFLHQRNVSVTISNFSNDSQLNVSLNRVLALLSILEPVSQALQIEIRMLVNRYAAHRSINSKSNSIKSTRNLCEKNSGVLSW